MKSLSAAEGVLLLLYCCLAGIFTLATTVQGKPAETTFFRPGTLPDSLDGSAVHAHGGDVFTVETKNGTRWYWYGTTQKLQPGWISEGIQIYSSWNLAHWQHEGIILHNENITGLPYPAPYRIERPKILFNAGTGKYVLLFHVDTPAFEYPAVGVAESSELTGKYTWVRAFKPDGRDSYDMTAFQGADGNAYLIRSVENAFLGISPLDDDFHDTKGICTATAQAEAPAVFMPPHPAYFNLFIVGSHLTGWAANPALLFQARAPSLCAAHVWLQTSPARGRGSQSTFESQAAAVFPFYYEDGEVLFIYMGDRWNAFGPGSVGNASYVWLPLLPTPDGSYELVYFDEWSPASVKPMLLAAKRWSWRRAVALLWSRVRYNVNSWCRWLHAVSAGRSPQSVRLPPMRHSLTTA